MSPTVLYAHLHPGVVTAASQEFQAPGPSDFWQPLIGSGAWALTRPSVLMLLSVIILGAFYLVVSRRLTVVPGKTQWMAEGVYYFARDTIGRDIIGSKDFKPFIPFIFTLFTLILLNNVFGIIPFVQYPSLSRIGFPIALTAIVYVVYQVVGIRSKGGFIGWVKSMLPPGLPGWIVPMMFVLELMRYFITQPVTLALRIFGNMFAGHLMLLLFALGGEYLLLETGNIGLQAAGVVSFLVFIVMTFFELLIAVLQAFIFALLAALYIGDAVSEGH